MPCRRISVVVTRRLPERVSARMEELFDCHFGPEDAPMPPGQIAELLPQADVLVPNLRDRIDQALLARAGDRLRLIANYGSGVDHIDVETARQRGIQVTNTPDVLTEDTADMTMAMILALLRRMPEGMALMRGDTPWEGWSPTGMCGARVAGKRLGILGMGRIGQALARRATAFGMRIDYHNRRRLRPETEQELAARYRESLDQMVAGADVLAVTCPHTPATFHLLNARRLKLMKPGAVIVNTSRGEVIDQNAMTRMLRNGEIGGAALDVVTPEAEGNPRLRELPNVILLPHMASATHEARLEMGEKVLINIKTWADGHRPPDLVLPALR